MMRALVFGALVGLLVVVFGVPLGPALAVLSVLAQPVALAFAAGLLARPLLPGMRRRTA